MIMGSEPPFPVLEEDEYVDELVVEDDAPPGSLGCATEISELDPPGLGSDMVCAEWFWRIRIGKWFG